MLSSLMSPAKYLTMAHHLTHSSVLPDVDLPSIDEEIALINSKKPTLSPPVKKSHNILNDSPSKSTVSSSVKDYGRTPLKSRKAAKADDASSDSLSSPSKKTKTDEEPLGSASLAIPKSPVPSSVSSRPLTSKSGARNVLLRASQFNDGPIIDSPQINMGSMSAKAKSIKASNLKFGFVGLGFMGQRLLKNLLNSGHKVTIWNRTPQKCKEFVEAGAKKAETPADVVMDADVTFSCLSDPKASKEIVFGPFGILAEMNPSKSFVEMSSIDPETSNDISEAILSKGGRYLEAPMIGNGKEAAEEGELTIVAAGDRSLYEECSSCFQAMSKQTFFLGHQVGSATKMNLICSMLYGTMIGSLVECCALVDRIELPLKDFKEIIKLSPMSCPLLNLKIDQILANDWSIHMPLGHLQKDLRLSLAMSEEYNQTIPITAATNEVYKHAKRTGYEDHDAAAIYLRSRY